MHTKCTIPRQKLQKFSGEGHSPPQIPSPLGGRLPKSSPQRLQRLDTRACPPNESPGFTSASIVSSMMLCWNHVHVSTSHCRNSTTSRIGARYVMLLYHKRPRCGNPSDLQAMTFGWSHTSIDELTEERINSIVEM